MRKALHPEEIEERRSYFQRIWRDRFVNRVSRLPAYHQGTVHDLLKEAFRAGATFERRKQEPMQTGGMD